MAPYLGHSFAPATMWNLHTIQPKYFTPTYSEVIDVMVMVCVINVVNDRPVGNPKSKV
jgi:hypothetical protein